MIRLRTAGLLAASLGLAVALPGGASAPRQDLERCWGELASTDGAAAYRAMGQLAVAPREAVPFLDERLRPVAGAPRRRIARLIGDLGSEHYAVRDKAQRELERLHDLAEEELNRALAAGPTLELRRRIDGLLAKLDLLNSPEQLRALRAMEVLENIGTSEAQRVLRRLAGGAPAARQTREARASLERLARRAKVAP